MSEELWDQAEQLASRPYEITIEGDTLSDGQIVYLARNPKLPGCKSQGDTIDEAKSNLAEARVDYIHALLDEGLPIPEPMQIVFMSDLPQVSPTEDKVVAIPLLGDDVESFVFRAVTG
jgi:predicted RNase H-like HicB family nuclease